MHASCKSKALPARLWPDPPLARALLHTVTVVPQLRSQPALAAGPPHETVRSDCPSAVRAPERCR